MSRKRFFIILCLLFFAMINIRCAKQSTKTAGGTAKAEKTPGGKAETAAKLTSEVRIHKGMPALFVNGKLTSQILGGPYRPGETNFTDFTKAGIKIFNIYLRFPWTGPEEYDFSGVDKKLDFYLKLEPDALFIVRILLSPGDWWCEKFPDEITMRDDGSPAGMFRAKCYPSLASDIYRELSYKAMKAFIEHVESKWGEHIVGYQPGNGFGGEWLMFNSFWEVRPGAEPPKKFGVEDYSPPARREFKKWLRKKYGSVAELRRAWGDTKVTFETAEPPNEIQRYSSTYGIFFDPAVSMRVTDFFSFFNDITADMLLENCKSVKELIGGRKIVGVFYGYLWCNFPNLSVNHTGHLGMARVFSSPYVDFIASPYTYDNKQIGGANNSQTLPEAAQLHGKLYFNEVDTETHLHRRQWRWGNCLNNPKSWEETRSLLIRDYGYAFTKGFGMWWTDLHGGNFHDEKITELLGDLQRIDEKHLDADKTSNADIAVILDEETFKYFGDGEPLFNALLTAQKQWQLAYLGAPWEPHLITDMDNPKLKDFKVYIFLNTFRVTDEQREAIHNRLKRNGATAVWVYAPGYIGDERLSVDYMKELTGIELAEDSTTGELRVEISSYDHPYTRGLPEGFVYGTDVDVESIIRWYDHQIYLKDPRDPSLRRDLPGFRISPRFYSNDADAKVLGQLSEVDEPGLVVKQQPGGWTSVYSSAPILPAALLRNILRAAGGHIYSDANDVVYANKNFLCIYAPKGGSRTVHLPERARVVDLLENRVLTEGASEFEMAVPPNSTLLLGLEKPAEKEVFLSYKADRDVEPTADAESKFWKGVRPVIIDNGIENNPLPEFKNEARSRWTKDYLYFLFSGPYEKLTLKPEPDTTKETYRLWEWDVFELYIGADFENINLYREFQVSPQGEFLDLNIDSSVARPGHSDERFWDSGFKVKARVDSARKIWCAEMRIPISGIDEREPKAGNEMRVNVYRLSGTEKNRDFFMAWQPTGVWNPHRPAKFGKLRLVEGR